MKRGRLLLLLGCLLLAVTGCVVLSPEQRRENARQLAATAGWQEIRLPTDAFVLAGFVPQPVGRNNKTLTIYIEGDGLAWLNGSTISPDPTPIHPIALQLALRQAQGAVAYLARPCQYVGNEERRGCSRRYWTDRRFAPEVIKAANQAIDLLKERFGAQQLVLVGYSGGGAVAALAAARRHDVALLVTVAGNLDHQQWTKQHQASPLTGSLNPADAWHDLQGVPQLHFVGGRDTVVGRGVAEAFAARFPPDRRPEIRLLPDADHVAGWVEQWPALSAEWAK